MNFVLGEVVDCRRDDASLGGSRALSLGLSVECAPAGNRRASCTITHARIAYDRTICRRVWSGASICRAIASFPAADSFVTFCAFVCSFRCRIRSTFRMARAITKMPWRIIGPDRRRRIPCRVSVSSADVHGFAREQRAFKSNYESRDVKRRNQERFRCHRFGYSSCFFFFCFPSEMVSARA